MQKLDLTNKRFGRLLVTEFAGVENECSMWWCLCDCGNKVKKKGYLLKKGVIKSCGCLRVDMAKNKNFIDGLRDTRICKIWRNMKRRCYIESLRQKMKGAAGEELRRWQGIR